MMCHAGRQAINIHGSAVLEEVYCRYGSDPKKQEAASPVASNGNLGFSLNRLFAHESFRAAFSDVQKATF